MKCTGTYTLEDGTKVTRTYTGVQTCPHTVNIGGQLASLDPGTCICTKEDCFIATATYGSPQHLRVQFLRNFRDQVVLKSKYENMFRALLDGYYHFSPPIAAVVARNPRVGGVLRRTVIEPFITFSETVARHVERKAEK